MTIKLYRFLNWRAINLYFVLPLLFTAISCEQEKTEPSIPPSTDVVATEIIDKLKEAGFDTSEGLYKFEDGYIVEHDIFLTEDEIENLAASASPKENQKVEHYRTNMLVGNTPRIITVYIDPSFDTYIKNSLNAAIRRYNEVGMGLVFLRSYSTAAAIKILPFYRIAPILAFSSFPQGGNPANMIRLNTYYYFIGTVRPDVATVIAHEIGHAIGFHHTDFLDNRFSCGRATSPEEAGREGALQISGTPARGTANSWMLACSDNTDKPFTSFDIMALKAVYPPRGVGERTAVYRYWNNGNTDHLYTTSWGELGAGRSGYGLEGVSFYLHKTAIVGTIPIYRYHNSLAGNHFYTANFDELGSGRNGYGYEGILGYAFPSWIDGTVPVYRYWNSGIQNHFYTTDWNELGGGDDGYGYEGIAFYAYQ